MAPSKKSSSSKGYREDDPLWNAIRPPADETPEQAAARRKGEADAKLISDKIDEDLRIEAAQLKKKRTIRLLLLGQSESGKSTTLKQFQILYSRDAFANERLSWRLVIQLNLIKSFRRILEAVTNSAGLGIDSPTTALSIATSDDRWDTSANGIAYPRMSVDSLDSSMTGTTESSDFSDYKLRLMPLLRAGDILTQKLASPDSLHYRGDALGGREGFSHLSWSSTAPEGNSEVYVRAGDFGQLRNGLTDGSGDAEIEEATNLICQAREDMIRVWSDPRVHRILTTQKVNLVESSGFFLDDLDRITHRDYLPTNDDILNARLKTIGVVEHSFSVAGNGDKPVDWRIYDVGGSRHQRPTWVPFFDNVQAIIFLAPVSVFDQVLTEDKSVNRLEDSLMMWRDLCKNETLKKIPLVLFLNKCDLLRRKLESGVRLSRYMTSYGDRANDYDSILRYFKSKFDAIRKQHSKDGDRESYVYTTSVTETHATHAIISSGTSSAFIIHR